MKHILKSKITKRISIILMLIIAIVNVSLATPLANKAYADENQPESKRSGLFGLGVTYYYTTSSGHEVDFVEDQSRQYYDDSSAAGGGVFYGFKLDESSAYYEEAKKELEEKGLPLTLNYTGHYEYTYTPSQNTVAQKAGTQTDGTEKPGENSNDNSDQLDGIAGIILFPAKLIPLIFGRIIDGILGLFAGNGNAITLGDIIFNKVEIIKIDFFNFNSNSQAANSIRTSVATWYYAFRNIASVILLVILLYTGIRMAISTVSKDKAKYSEMLVNWVVSIALLYVLQYLIQAIIFINNQLVDIFAKSYSSVDLSDPMNLMFNTALKSIGFTEEMGASICYALLLGMTFVFLLSYIKRMVTIAFLIVISPLVTITYSVDKMNDGKSQALNIWFKEFSYNILIQPFHCITYLFLTQTGLTILQNEKSISAIIISTMMVYFMYESEKIIKHIFHFKSNTMSDTVKHATLVASAMGTFDNLGITRGNKYSSIEEPKDDNQASNANNAQARPIPNTSYRSQYIYEGNTENSGNQNQSYQGNATTNNNRTASRNRNRASATGTSNSISGTNSNGQKGNSRIGKTISRVTGNQVLAKYYLINKTIGNSILRGGISLATGNLTTAMASVTNEIAKGVNEGKENAAIGKQNTLQESYNKLRDEKEQELIETRVSEEMAKQNTEKLTKEEIKREKEKIRQQIMRDEGKGIQKKSHDYMQERTMALSNGAMPKNADEKKLAKDINRLRMAYANQGMDEDKVDKQISKDLKNIEAEKYKYGNIVQKNATGIKDDTIDAVKTAVRPIVHHYYRRKRRKENNY